MARRLERRNLIPDDNTVDIPGGNPLFGISANFPQLIEVDIDKCEPNPHQPRVIFDQAAIETLAADIDRRGQLMPGRIRLNPEKGRGWYHIIHGERRWRAVRRLGRATWFAIVADSDADLAEDALAENLQREDLTVVEIARAYGAIKAEKGYSLEQLAGVVGRSKGDVSKTLGILDLPREVLDEYLRLEDRPGKSIMFELVSAPADVRLGLWDQVKAGATVKDLRAARNRLATPTRSQPLNNLESFSPLRFTRRLGILAKDVEVVAADRDRLTPEQREDLRYLRDQLNRILD